MDGLNRQMHALRCHLFLKKKAYGSKARRITRAPRPLFFVRLLFLLLLLCGVGGNSNTSSFTAALTRLFVLRSQSGAAGDHQACRRRVLDLMRRQRIPASPEKLRSLSDTDLMRVGILAAMGGLGQWVRDPGTDAVMVDDDGRLVRALVPTAVENDVMLCIICALLTVIAVFHVLLPSAAPASS